MTTSPTPSDYDLEPVCGCLDCTKPREDIVDIPGKGPRAVCENHLEDLRVNGGVER